MIGKEKILYDALAYDDVLLVPAFSEVLPKDVRVGSNLTKNIKLNVPLISAAMDTVTESSLAISMANQGGIGFIHKNMSIEQQASEVRRVKRSQAGLIVDPIFLYPTATLNEAKELMHDNEIGGIPIVDKDHCLLGIITNRDIRFVEDLSVSVTTLMTKPNLITATRKVTIEQAKKTLQKNRVEKLPIVDEQNRLTGLITIKDIIKNQRKPNASRDKMKSLLVGAAIGPSKDTFERLEALIKEKVDVICIDTAHAHSKNVLQLVKKIKQQYKNLELVVGNIATPEGAMSLFEAGADCIKVGIGPGSICTTRVIAGIGIPQFSAILKVAEALKGKNIPIIADGGIRFSGDITKAIAAGAHCVMIGSMLAGTEESPGETIIYEGRKFKTYRGMGSLEAMTKGSKDRYFQEYEYDTKGLIPEGISARVPFKGTVSEVVHQLVGGLRSGMGYCGAKNITELQKSKFVRVTQSGIIESHVHDVKTVREAPNYSISR